MKEHKPCFDLVTLCPPIVWGPPLSSTLNTRWIAHPHQGAPFFDPCPCAIP